MERVVKKSHKFAEAEEWDILQHIKMDPEERQKAAAELRIRVYGKNAPDVREACRRQ